MTERRTLDDSAVAGILNDVFDELGHDVDDDTANDDERGTGTPTPSIELDVVSAGGNHNERRLNTRHRTTTPDRLTVDTETTHGGRRNAGTGGGERKATPGAAKSKDPATALTPRAQANVYLPARTLDILRRIWDSHDVSFSEIVTEALERHARPATDEERLAARRGRRKEAGAESRILRLSSDELATLDNLATHSQLPRNRMVMVLIDRVEPSYADPGGSDPGPTIV